MLDHEKAAIQARNKLPKETNCSKYRILYVNKIVGIRDGKELLLFLSSPTTTGYCLQAEDNIKLTIYTASNKEKEGRKHIMSSSNRKYVQRY